MSEVTTRVVLAATLLWLGMVLAISFIEAPLKFRTPGLELKVGLAIGRLVFRALNMAEIVWALVVAGGLILAPQSLTITLLAGVTDALLVIQLAAVRPRLNRRADQVLTHRHAQDPPRSSVHHIYVVLEILKVAALAGLSCYLLAA